MNSKANITQFVSCFNAFPSSLTANFAPDVSYIIGAVMFTAPRRIARRGSQMRKQESNRNTNPEIHQSTNPLIHRQPHQPSHHFRLHFKQSKTSLNTAATMPSVTHKRAILDCCRLLATNDMNETKGTM